MLEKHRHLNWPALKPGWLASLWTIHLEGQFLKQF